jgi:hypothetical protein
MYVSSLVDKRLERLTLREIALESWRLIPEQISHTEAMETQPLEREADGGL